MATQEQACPTWHTLFKLLISAMTIGGGFVQHLNPGALAVCPFCKEEVEETLFHVFLYCPHSGQTAALSIFFGALDLEFSETVYFLYPVLSG